MGKCSGDNMFSIEQAGNWLKEKSKTLEETIKKAIRKEAKISIAPPKDRKRFIGYAVSLLEKVDSEDAEMFFSVTGKSRSVFSNSDIAKMLKNIILLRADGYGIEQIAYILKTSPDILRKIEQIAINAVSKAIEKSQAKDVPILGGLN